MNEMFEVVNRDGETIGHASRSEVHGDPSLLHKVVHVLVFNDKGEILLQKRSLHKDVAPGKWDTSVGGHVAAGEDIRSAALRETGEELGIAPADIEFLYSYVYSDRHESELVHTYRCLHCGPFSTNEEEISEVRFWTLDSVERALQSGVFSGHFAAEFDAYRSYSQREDSV